MDLIVFAVGLLVSMLVIYGIFSRVTLEMGEAKHFGAGKVKPVPARRA